MKQIKIYALSSSKTPEDIRYIGKTTGNIKQRLYRHISSSKYENTYKSRWVNKELKKGNKIIITEIFIVPEYENWEKWEIHFISDYKRKGYKLTNTTIGGENLSGINNPFYGKKHSKKTIKKIKNSNPLKKAVDMFDLKGDLIKSYISISEAGLENNLSMHIISDVCRKRPKFKTAGGFVWRFKGEPFSLKYENPAESLRKEICQYDKKGNLIKEFNSISDAAQQLSISVGNISRCCNYKIKSVKNYIWRFKGDKFSLDDVRSDAKKVIQCSLTGAYINEFKSISEATKNTKIYSSGIYFCCTNKYKHAGGFKWKFA
jgi:hypothetical protein